VVECALKQQEALIKLRKSWKERGLPELKVRMGLHTGDVLCGNVGSSDRFKYTIIGDNVNLSSRLENMNKRYGTYILISEELYFKVKEMYLCRVLDLIAVKGKTKPTKVYTILSRMSECNEKQKQICELSDKSFSLYLQRQFKECMKVLKEIDHLSPGDLAVKLLQSRCEKYSKQKLDESWSGIEVMDEK
jgi:adenylate cyclase